MVSQGPPWSSEDLLRQLSLRGAARVASVVLRSNRRTIWSLTAKGARFNLHRAFSKASHAVLDDLAIIAREAPGGSAEYRAAAYRIARWPVVLEAIRDLRAEADLRRGGGGRGHCCATPEQRAYLAAIYAQLNRERFGERLPTDVPVRLSSRMRSRLGQMVPGEDPETGPYVVEIALNADLMLPGNDDIRTETLVHEMAHVADLLEHGNIGHGSTWRRLAVAAGCEPRACRHGSIRRRRSGSPPTPRVPPIPG